MKKIIMMAASAALMLAAAAVAAAQAIPGDPLLVKGTLDNGLTYYIRSNANPAGCADFYIVHGVGALQEEDNQNGLAHFLEHMAFNGTKHYPDKGIIEFLEKEGVRFGANINAYTSKTETVYNISSVPLVRESFVDSVLMVLHDWSCDISCEQHALDDERGVISEEWRRRDVVKTRVFEKQAGIIYDGSKQTRRNVIGSLEVINGFKRDEILDFYHTWYRPDMQAIIVVGDFDAKAMEAKVRSKFSDIASVPDAPQKELYAPKPYDGPQIMHFTDPDINYYAFKVFIRQPFPEAGKRSDEAFYEDWYRRQIVSSVLADRLEYAVKKKQTPVKRAVLVTNPYGTDFYVTQFTLLVKDSSQFDSAIELYESQRQRLLQYGISRQEYEVAKLNVYKKFKLNVPQSDKDLKTPVLVKSYLENFLRGYSTATPATLLAAQKRAFDKLGYDDVCAYIKPMFDSDQRVYSCSVNEDKRDVIPSDAQIYAMIDSVSGLKTEPGFMEYETVSLASADPQPGHIVKVSAAKDFPGEIWKLSNGAKVYWRPSEAVNSGTHISMSTVFHTGFACLPQDNLNASRFALSYLKKYAGIDGVDRTKFKNDPSFLGIGSQVAADRRSGSLVMSATAEKAEDMFRMTYLQLTDPYFATEEELAREKKANLDRLSEEKKYYELFNLEDKALRFGNDPWSAELDSAAVEGLTLELVRDANHRLFGKFSDMDVFICSDLPVDEVKALVEKYVASLSGDYDVKPVKYHPHLPVYKGQQSLVRTYPQKTGPRCSVSCDWRLKVKQTPANEAAYDVLDFILSRRYLNKIREERGGTYTISFRSDSYSDDPDMKESNVSFDTRPEMKDTLVADVFDIIAVMAADGPTEAEMSDAVKYLAKRYKERKVRMADNLIHKNMEVKESVLYGSIFDYDYDKAVKSVKASDIRKLASKIASSDRLLNVYSEE